MFTYLFNYFLSLLLYLCSCYIFRFPQYRYRFLLLLGTQTQTTTKMLTTIIISLINYSLVCYLHEFYFFYFFKSCLIKKFVYILKHFFLYKMSYTYFQIFPLSHMSFDVFLFESSLLINIYIYVYFRRSSNPFHFISLVCFYLHTHSVFFCLFPNRICICEPDMQHILNRIWLFIYLLLKMLI